MLGKKKKQEKEMIEAIQESVDAAPDLTVDAPGEEEEVPQETEGSAEEVILEETEVPMELDDKYKTPSFNMKKEEPRRMTILSAQLLENGHIKYELVSNKHLGNVGETYVD